MLLKNIVSGNTVVCTEEMPLEQVFGLMDRERVDHVVVIENYAHRKPIGLITEHDICMQIVGRGRSPRGMTAANVMNTHIVKSQASDTLADCLEMLKRTGFITLCVVDESGMLGGTVSQKQIESELEKVTAAVPMDGTFYGHYAAADRIF